MLSASSRCKCVSLLIDYEEPRKFAIAPGIVPSARPEIVRYRRATAYRNWCGAAYIWL